MFRIFYGDGATFTGSPEDAPAHDVQAIVQPDQRKGTGNVGTVVLSGWDWYYWREDLGEWWGSDLHGLLDQLLSRQPVNHVCQGRHCPSDRYREIINAAKKTAEAHRHNPAGR